MYYQCVFYTLNNKSACFITTTSFVLKTLTCHAHTNDIFFLAILLLFDCFWTHIAITCVFFTVYATSILYFLFWSDIHFLFFFLLIFILLAVFSLTKYLIGFKNLEKLDMWLNNSFASVCFKDISGEFTVNLTDDSLI